MVERRSQVYFGEVVRATNTLINNILSSGMFTTAECYDITLATGQTYHATSYDVPLTGISVLTKVGTTGPFTYQTGLVIVRDRMTQKAGVEAGSLELLVADGGVGFTLAGYPITQAARYGFLRGAKVQQNRLFMNSSIGNNTTAVGWFSGTIQDMEADRFMIHMTIDDIMAYLANQQMPPKVCGVGCFNQVYDAGCGLLRSTFTVSGTLTSVGDAAHFTASAMTQPTGYFKMGSLTFTSGVNNGLSRSVNFSTQSSGVAFQLRMPFPAAPSPGDTFQVYPGCDLQQPTCSNTNAAVGPPFNNLPHFAGTPYVPPPETPLDGGTDNPPVQTRGATAGTIIGSQPSARYNYGNYRL